MGLVADGLGGMFFDTWWCMKGLQSCFCLFVGLLLVCTDLEAQELTLVRAERQAWSGGPPGRMGQYIRLQVEADSLIEPLVLYLRGDNCPQHLQAFGKGELAPGVYMLTWKLQRKGQRPESSAGGNQGPSPCPEGPAYDGAAYLLMGSGEAAQGLHISDFENLPHLAYP